MSKAQESPLPCVYQSMAASKSLLVTRSSEQNHAYALTQVLAKKAGPAVEIPPEMEKKFEVGLVIITC